MQNVIAKNCSYNSKNFVSNPSRTFAVMPMETNGGQLTSRKKFSGFEGFKPVFSHSGTTNLSPCTFHIVTQRTRLQKCKIYVKILHEKSFSAIIGEERGNEQMLLSLKINNCLIYNSEVEFSMRANMHYKRFPCNVVQQDGVNTLKTAVLIGPNNSGKTNFVRILATLKALMLGKEKRLSRNLFSENPIVGITLSFLAGGKENLFEIRYDTSQSEYVFERFGWILRDSYNNIKIKNLFIRDNKNKKYFSEDPGLDTIMKATARNNILIYLVKIANFVLNADLYLDDYRYLRDDEIKIVLQESRAGEENLQENALRQAAPLTEMLHLASVYKGVVVPSVLFDSTGTKKMAALASYVIDALENGRILVIDELDNSLHFRLTRAILALFNNEMNQNAQLIATVHDVSLLDCQKLFRKEQIWFTHKDRQDAYLYSLADFTNEKTGIRDTSDIIEKYKKGMFGALPEPDLFSSLLEVKTNG